jgi:hypothetical protein
MPDGDGAYTRDNSEEEPWSYHVSAFYSPRKRPSPQRRSDRSPHCGHTDSDAIQCSEDAETDRRVGEQDDGAWEGEDYCNAFDDHYPKHRALLKGGGLDECRVRRSEAYKRESNSAAFEAVQDAETTRCWWEDEELDEAPHDAVAGEEEANACMVDAEAARELERELGVGDMWHFLCMHEDWEKLVVGYRVQGEECVRDEVYDGLAGEDFGEGRTGLWGFGRRLGLEVVVKSIGGCGGGGA